MARFNTPGQLEAHLVEQLTGRSLICEVPWEDELLSEVRLYWTSSAKGQFGAAGTAARFPATNLVFLADWAVRKYAGNELWTDLKLSGAEQNKVGVAFEQALSKLGLETFPQLAEERARRFVAVILAHGGIPASMAADFLLRDLFRALREGEAASGEELVAFWRAHPPAYFPSPVRRFLLHGGEAAVDLLDRLVALAGIARDEIETHPERQGLPRHLVRAFLEIPATEVRAAALLPKPQIRLDPYDSRGIGPQLVLPPVSREQAQTLTWSVEDGSGRVRELRGFYRQDAEPLPLYPTDFWTVRARSGDKVRSWTFECFGEEPMVSFDPDTWHYLSDAGGIRTERAWVLMGKNASAASVEATGLRPLSGETANQLSGAWSDYSAQLLDLSAVDLLALLVGGREQQRLRVLRTGTGIDLLLDPVRDVTSIDGASVVADVPELSLPAGGPWQLRFVGEDGVVEQELGASDARQTLRLPLEPRLGRYEVNVRGRIGADLPATAFVLVPGLRATTPDDPCLPGVGDVAVTVSAADEVGLHGAGFGTPATVVVPAGETREELWARDRERRRVGMLVSVPRLRWALRSGDGALAFGQTALDIEPDQIGTEIEALVVSVDRPHQSIALLVGDGRGQDLQEEGPVFSNLAGRASFDLRAVRETARAVAERGLRLSVEIEGRRLLVAEHRPPAPAQAIRGPQIGDRVRGRVGNVTDHAVYVAGEGWQGVAYPEKQAPGVTYRVGDEVEGIVSWIAERLKLDLRPFDPHRFALQQEVNGRVVRVSKDAVWVDLDGYDGRVVAERLPVDRPPAKWQINDQLTGRVVDIDVDRRLISLGVAPFRPDGFEIGSKVPGRVSALLPSGIVLNLRAIHGWVPRHAEPRNGRPQEGQRVYAWVESVQRRRERVVLSMRSFNERGYHVGQVLPARVVHKAKGTIVVQLPDRSSGRIPPAELPAHLDPPTGAILPTRVVHLDAERRAIILSARGVGATYRYGDFEAHPSESPFAALKGTVGR